MQSLNKETFIKSGYVIVRNFLDHSDIHSCFNDISGLEPKLYVPFSSEAWGFGNLTGIGHFDSIARRIDATLQTFELTEEKLLLNHMVCNRKPAWIGPEVEYHQEILNSKTFAAGANKNYIRNNWVQIYLPLHDEEPGNGGLRVIRNSHTLDVMEHEDIISPNFGHKRRIKSSILSELMLSEEYDLIDLNLNGGDILFFSPFLIHASPSNGSANERISLVAQARPKSFEANQSIFDTETAFRQKFVTENLTRMLSKSIKTKKYSEFIKVKE